MKVQRILLPAAAVIAAAMTVATGSSMKNGQHAGVDSVPEERTANVSGVDSVERGQNGPSANDYELSAQAEKAVLGPDERVILNLTLRNNSADEAYVVVSGRTQNGLEVKDGRGRKVPLSQRGSKLLGRDAEIGKWVLKKIEPGTDVSYQVYVHYFYELSPGDTYTVTVTREVLMKDKKQRVKIKSNPVEIRIENSH